ncbi:MAG TPA: alpha/beta hydrolase [bacterium]|nr:alpha/beta hydrolase [bacterium]
MLRRFISLLCLLWLLSLAACDTPLRQWGPLADGALEGFNYYAQLPAAARNVPYVPGGDPAQVLDIYAIDAPGPAPVFVFLHGGYWQSGTIKLYGSLAKSLARLGVVTVTVEYRLYPQVTFPAFMDDAVAALNWVHAHIGEFGGDPNRIVLSGHSAGAHMAALLLVDDRFRNRLAFPVAQLAGAALFAGAFDFYRENKLDMNIIRRVMGGDEETVRLAQPIVHVRADVPPMLIVNGDRDKLTSEPQAAFFAQAMRDAGAPVTYAQIPGGDHLSVILDIAPGAEGPAWQALLPFLGQVYAKRK